MIRLVRNFLAGISPICGDSPNAINNNRWRFVAANYIFPDSSHIFSPKLVEAHRPILWMDLVSCQQHPNRFAQKTVFLIWSQIYWDSELFWVMVLSKHLCSLGLSTVTIFILTPVVRQCTNVSKSVEIHRFCEVQKIKFAPRFFGYEIPFSTRDSSQWVCPSVYQL